MWLKAGPLDFQFAKESWRIDPERFLSRTFMVVWIKVVGEFFDSKKQRHYSRNTHNVVDRSEIKDITREIKGWEKASFISSRYHRQGSEKELYLWKYINKDGREAVLDNDDKLIKSPLNKGTYNYGKGLSHIPKDWVPYIIWGNTPDDPTSWYHRLYGTYHTEE